VKVYLLNAAGTKIDSTNTAGGGKYLFSNLRAGTYSVQFVKSSIPAIYSGFTAKDTTGVSDIFNSDADKTTGKTKQVTLAPVLNPVTAADSAKTFNYTLDAGLLPKINININCVQAPPISVVGITIDACKGKVYPTLSATIVGTGTVDWYKKATGGTAVATGTLTYTPTGNVAANDTFYLAARSTLPASANCPMVMERTRVIVVAKNCIDTVDLALKKMVDKKVVKLGDVITYTIKVWNESKTNATGVEVTDQLPAGVQYVSSTASRGGYASATGIWAIGNVGAAGDTVTLSIKAKVIGEGVSFNTAEISKTDQKDKDSTPGNNKDGEDDLDRVCVGAPINLCIGQSVVISVPVQYTNVMWFRNGVQVAAGSTYIITQSGSYTYTASNNTCPASGCCATEVIIADCCPTNICIPVIMIKQKK
jgi:uncharacterized repeat protein (TIGR01451 family)